MILNNPYIYHPHPLCKVAAGDLFTIISQKASWQKNLAQGKMLGILIVRNPRSTNIQNPQNGNEQTPPLQDKDTHVHYINNEYSYLAAYSGILSIGEKDSEIDAWFVPAVYDLTNPSDFYKAEEHNISLINQRIKLLEANAGVYKNQIAALKRERKERSQALQLEIFKHFNFTNFKGETLNIVDIFYRAGRGLPPGGAGECAAPRLLNYASTHALEPVAMAEFWHGVSPRMEIRLHKQFYPSCIEKCSPIISFMLGIEQASAGKRIVQENNSNTESINIQDIIVYDDKDIVVVNKPAGILSTPGKDLTEVNIETLLHSAYPVVKGPMLVHRLDQATTGLMLAAKNAQSFKTLQQGFLDHSIRKQYQAWVAGLVESECGVINLPICPNPDDRTRQTVDRQFGKQSITRYRVIKREENRTLLALFPFTGRTHQLRMHCASPFGLDIPIEGDNLYTIPNYKSEENEAESKAKQLQLFAMQLSFPHPVTGERKTFTLKGFQ